MPLLLSVASSAAAETPSSAAEADAEARTLYNAGVRAYEAGQFDIAVRAMSAAFVRSPRPSVLFSLAQAERRLFTLTRDPSVYKSAVGHFTAYIDENPHAARRVDAVAALAELQALSARAPAENADAQAQKPNAQSAPTVLLVSIEPSAARVEVDGEQRDERPVILPTQPGPHRVHTHADGYFDDERKLNAVLGSVVASEIVLRSRPALVSLSAPDGTLVTIDGALRGITPLPDVELPAGAHRIAFAKSGRLSETHLVKVRRGERLQVAAKMNYTRQRQVSHALLLGGAGAAVVAATSVTVTLVLQGKVQSVDDKREQANISLGELRDRNDFVGQRDTWRTVSVISSCAAAALLASGAALFVWDSERPSAPERVGQGVRVRVGFGAVAGEF